MPRMEVTDCEDGHGKACKSRPGRMWALLYCCCGCHHRWRAGRHPYWPWHYRGRLRCLICGKRRRNWRHRNLVGES